MEKLFKHVKDVILENKFKYILGILLLIVVDGLQMITPLVIGAFTDSLTSGMLTTQGIYKYMLYILVIAIGVALGRFGWRMSIITVAKKLEYELRNKVFKHLEKMSRNYYNHHRTGDLMAHCTNDISQIRMAFGGGTVMIIDSLFMIIVTLLLMIFKINFKLTIIALLPLPIITIFVLFMTKLMRKRFKEVQEAFSALSEIVQESFSGIRVIKSFVQEKLELEKFNKINQNDFDKNMNLVKIKAFAFPLVTLVTMISMVISLIYGGILVIDGVITIGKLVAFLGFVGMLTWPMMALGFVFHRLQQGRVSLERINVILNTKPEIIDSSLLSDIDDVNDILLEIKNLNFKYPNTNELVLKNINMKIKKGENIAIIGKTGSGKTTLLNLLLRFYNIDSEKIYFNGKDIVNLSIGNIREKIGYVPQDNFLFSKTIEQNLMFSDEKISFDKIVEAAKISKINSEIDSFELGYKTMLGEKGVNMSGGQKQRVSIARALVKSPDLIILDDSLSAVDTKTEEVILSHLENELKDKTSIVISHRISTIKNSDYIYVLDNGKIIEEGNHNELLENRKLYFDLYQKQLLEEKIMGGQSGK